MSTPTAAELVEEERSKVASFSSPERRRDSMVYSLAQRLATALAELQECNGNLEHERLDNYSVRQKLGTALAEMEHLRRGMEALHRDCLHVSHHNAIVIELRRRAEAAEAEVERLRGDESAADTLAAIEAVNDRTCALCGSHIVSVSLERHSAEYLSRQQIVWTCCNACQNEVGTGPFQWTDFLDEPLQEAYQRAETAEAKLAAEEDGRMEWKSRAEAAEEGWARADALLKAAEAETARLREDLEGVMGADEIREKLTEAQQRLAWAIELINCDVGSYYGHTARADELRRRLGLDSPREEKT